MTASEVQRLLQGKWIMTNTRNKHYLIFKKGKYRSKHRAGTFVVEKGDNDSFLLDMSDVHHTRTLYVHSRNSITVTFNMHGESIVNEYRRDRGLMGIIQRIVMK